MADKIDDTDHLNFADMLRAAKDSNEDATDVLRVLVDAVRQTGRKGSMTLTVSLEQRDTSTHELGVTFKAKTTPPQINTMHSFYAHKGGGIAKSPEEHLFTGYDAERETGPEDGW